MNTGSSAFADDDGNKFFYARCVEGAIETAGRNSEAYSANLTQGGALRFANAAYELGLPVPPALLVHADEVIE